MDDVDPVKIVSEACARWREAEEMLLAIMETEAETTRRREALRRLSDTATELAARRRRRDMRLVGDDD